MATIEVDFDVYKLLTCRRKTEDMTYNDVLREMLNLPTPKREHGPSASVAESGDWVWKGVCFPAGTEFRATYRGRTYHAIVEGGQLVVGGERFTSPSKAAGAITKTSVNGWMFWECRLPGQSSWRIMNSLRS